MTTQIVFEPLIAWARSAWQMMKPASACGSVDGNTRLALVCGRPRGSKQRNLRIESSTSLMWRNLSRMVAPGYVEHRAEVARALLALGVHLDGGVATARPHQAVSSWRTSSERLIQHAEELGGDIVGETAATAHEPDRNRSPDVRRPSLAFELYEPLSMFCTQGRIAANCRRASP